MKQYDVVDLTSDSYLNPVPAVYDNGQHLRNVNQITSISVHHDATPRPHDYDSVARYRQEAASHYQRLGPGLQYHYKIDNVGTIFKIRPLTTWLYVVGSSENVSTIAICLDGYFHPDVNQNPTREQYEALSQLLVDLCDNHPEFPATYPDVRPHSDFSGTACCGNSFRPYVLQVNNKATAENIPAEAVYDWPELQPSAPTPPPSPTPPPPQVTYDTNFKPAQYFAMVKTHLDDFMTDARIKDYAPGETFDMVRKADYKDSSWLQTAYSVDKTPTRGIPFKDLKLVEPNTNPIPPDPSPVPTPPPPVQPPAPKPQDQSHDTELRGWLATFFASLVKIIQDLLSKLGGK